MLLRVLRQFAAVISRELSEQYSEDVATQPGRLLFPKHVHELDSGQQDAPDSLDIEYIRLAVARNETAWRDATVDTAVMTLGAQVSQQIGCAVFLERVILERLE